MYQEQKRSIVKHLDFLLLDMLMLISSYTMANILRRGWGSFYGNVSYISMAGVLLLLLAMVAILGDSYQNILRRGYLLEFKNVFIQSCVVWALAITYMFAIRTQMEYSRLVFGYFLVINIALTYAERIIWKRIVRRRLVNSKDRSCLLVISQYDGVEECLYQLRSERYKEFKIIGAIVYDKEMKGTTIENIPVVADRDHIFQYLKEAVVDEVFLNIGRNNPNQMELAEELLEMGLTVHINLELNLGNDLLPNQSVQDMCGCTVLTTSVRTATAFQVVVKRLLDIVGSIIGLLFTGIFFVIFAPIIYIQSPGPILFAQERVGRNGRRFKMYKFRSMYPDAEERKRELMDQNKINGLMFKMDDDPRIIPIGKVLRKLSIDEFPQFWNVLKGDMSLVGTRPPTVDEYEQYENHHRVRLAIKPGLTGMWQVSGRSNVTNFEEVVALDNTYIKNWSLRLDIKILFQTVSAVLQSIGSV